MLDEEGNRLTSHLSGFHVTDAANRLIEDEGFAYAYDVNGNLVRKTDKVSGRTVVLAKGLGRLSPYLEKLRVEEALTSLVPYLTFCSYMNTGSHTALGLGAYDLAFYP